MIRSLSTVLLTGLVLQGCMFAPGQHMNTDYIVRDGSPESSRIELIPITPKLIAQNQATAEPAGIPQALQSHLPDTYRIGPGDLLYITVWEHPELTAPSGSQTGIEANGRLVRPDGTLFYPYVGVINAAGLTQEQIRKEIAQKLARFIEQPQIDVSILRFASQKVSLSGAFKDTTPQPITTTPLTLLQAVGNANVDTTVADLSGLTLKRGGVEYRLDLDSLNRGGSSLHNLYLQDGDQIHLPYNDRKKIYVMGETLSARALTFKTSDMSLAEAIGTVGGLNQTTASGKEIYVLRGVDDLSKEPARVFQLDAKSPTGLLLADKFALAPNDIVYVGPANVTRWNRFISSVFPSANLLRTFAATQDDYNNNN